MQDESSFLAREQRALITRRLVPFALGWVGALAIWLVVFADEGRLSAAALALAGLQPAALLTAFVLCRAAPESPRVPAIVVATSIVLGVLSTGLVAVVGAYGEILAFMLLTLYLASALLFSWGWRAEMVLLVVTLSAWALVAEPFVFFVPLPELGAAITIGASLSIAIAEGRARASRRGWRRRRAQEEATRAFEASRNAYRDLAENAQDLIWSTDREGRLTYVNEATARFAGMPAPALLGLSIRDFYTDDPRNPDLDEVLARLAAGEVLPPFLIETRTPRGSRWIEVVSSAVRNVDGRLAGFRGISRDVTERQAAVEQLRASEARYRGLVQSQNELVVRMDLDGHVTFANDAYLSKFGERRQDVMGRTFFHVIHPEDLPTVTAAMRALQQPPHHALVEVRNFTTQGLRWIAWEGGVVLDEDGRPTELQSVGRDVTERRAAEDALRASEARARRVGDRAGHPLRS
jgi:PAS domain S-box-containing protein